LHTSFLQLGPLRIPVYGVFAALGLMLALGLSQRTARFARLDATAIWNAGMTAVIAAFVISRLLLVVFNFRSFLDYPLILLALPSLTSTGVLLTAIFMLGYLRWRRLPLLAVLDAFAPCGALLWAFLSLGHLVSGDRDGMANAPGSAALRLLGPVEPVEVYSMIAAALICVSLLLVLMRQSVRERAAGLTAGVGLLLTGLSLYFIDFVRLPSGLLPQAWIEPEQVVALAMAISGALLLLRAPRKMEDHAV
jgi:phosphatidylglycerol:prolipoprotein diacylglycerol transferase